MPFCGEEIILPVNKCQSVSQTSRRAQTEKTPHFVSYMVSLHSRVPASMQSGTQSQPQTLQTQLPCSLWAVATEWICRKISKWPRWMSGWKYNCCWWNDKTNFGHSLGRESDERHPIKVQSLSATKKWEELLDYSLFLPLD